MYASSWPIVKMYSAQKQTSYTLKTESREARLAFWNGDSEWSAIWYNANVEFEENRNYHFSAFATVYYASSLSTGSIVKNQPDQVWSNTKLTLSNKCTNSPTVCLTYKSTARGEAVDFFYQRCDGWWNHGSAILQRNMDALLCATSSTWKNKCQPLWLCLIVVI